jgi:thiol-disulfide isomerase/thioredoxin
MQHQKNISVMLNSKLFAFVLLILLFGIDSTLFPQSKNISSVKIISVSELNQILKQNKGNAVLVNVWATWCAPCREEFPDLVKLAKNYNEKLKIIGISADDSDAIDSKVIPFLKKNNAEFENYLIKVVDPEDFINLLNKDWSGAIPATFIYDNDGVQKEMLIGKRSFEEFEKAVKKVIN